MSERREPIPYSEVLVVPTAESRSAIKRSIMRSAFLGEQTQQDLRIARLCRLSKKSQENEGTQG